MATVSWSSAALRDASSTTTTSGDLAAHLDLRNLPLATTSSGRDFALKALHPSEHTIKSTRVPGGNRPSVTVSTDMIYTVPVASADATVTIYQFPHPVCPLVVSYTAGETTTRWAFYSTTFGGSVVAPARTQMRDVSREIDTLAELYRVTSQSMTAELIAPALSDQGTVTSAQFPLSHQIVWKDTTAKQNIARMFPLYVYDLPGDEAQWLTATSAYTARAKEGCYQPLKLTSMKYRTTNRPADHVSFDTLTVPIEISPEFTETGYPFYLPQAEHTFEFTGATAGGTVFRGLAANTAIRIRCRQTLELVVRPGTSYAPLAEPSPPPDDTAIKMYFEISARMKDAYPASYNDLGRLFDVVKSIGKKVLPYVEPALAALSLAPGPIGIASRGIATAVAGVKKADQMATAAARNRVPKKPKLKRKLRITRPTK